MIYLTFALFLCLGAVCIAAYKKHILYAILLILFLFYYPLQGLFLWHEIEFSSFSVNQYLFHEVSVGGALEAGVFVLLSSSGLFISSTFLDKFRVHQSHQPLLPLPKALVAVSIGLLFAIALFALVGPSEFFTNSRPAAIGGATLPLVGISSLLIPACSLRPLRNSKSRKIYTLFFYSASALCLIITLLLSKMHFLSYSISFIMLIQFRNVNNLVEARPRFVTTTKALCRFFIFFCCFLVVVLSFIFAGAARDSLNGGASSLLDLSHLAENSSGNVFGSLDLFYSVAVEGFTSLAGAFTFHDLFPQYAKADPLSFLVIFSRAFFQLLPNFLKSDLLFLSDPQSITYWYPNSIVSSSLADLYVVTGWLGALAFPFLLHLLYIIFVKTLYSSTSPFSSFSSLIQLGLLVFFIRGSIPVYIAFAVAFALLIYIVQLLSSSLANLRTSSNNAFL